MNGQTPAVPKNDESPIEAGEVRELDEVPFHEARHRAEAARSLAKDRAGNNFPVSPGLWDGAIVPLRE